jgi:hypothetical protein
MVSDANDTDTSEVDGTTSEPGAAILVPRHRVVAAVRPKARVARLLSVLDPTEERLKRAVEAV